jgi:hypothetical protein
LTERLAAARGALVAAEMFAIVSIVTIEAALAQVRPEEKYLGELVELVQAELCFMREAETRHDAWQAALAQRAHAAYCAAKRGEVPPAPLAGEAPPVPGHTPRDVADALAWLARNTPVYEGLRARVRNLKAARDASLLGLLPDMAGFEAARHAAACEQAAVLYGWRKEKRRPLTTNANGARKGQRLGH